MRRSALLACLALLLLPLAARAEDLPPLKRGFADGQFLDEYFGIRYAVEGVEKSLSLGGQTTLFNGKTPKGVEVEIQVQESPEPLSAADWLGLAKKSWAADGKERTEMEEGTDPHPWALYVQESLAGFKRHHGYAFQARGLQCFIVHAQVREKTETSADDIRSALAGLTVMDKTDSFVVAHVLAQSNRADPRDAMILAQASATYMQDQLKNPRLAEASGKLALASAKPDEFDDDQLWQINSMIGLAQLTRRDTAAGIPTWKKLVELAEKTSDPANLASNSWYNLACAYSLAKQLDDAFAALNKSLSVGTEEQRSMLKEHSQGDPDLENMRADPRWKEVGSAAGGSAPGDGDGDDEGGGEGDDDGGTR